jgi:hypothetical protein
MREGKGRREKKGREGDTSGSILHDGVRRKTDVEGAIDEEESRSERSIDRGIERESQGPGAETDFIKHERTFDGADCAQRLIFG